MNAASVPASRAARRWAVRAVLGAAILALLLSRRGTLAQVGAALGAVSPWVLAAAVAFYWAGQGLSAFKWQKLLRARGVEVAFWTCCRLYCAGMFGNLWLPTNIGGDALRASLLSRAAPISLADAAASVLIERLTGLAALLLWAVAGLWARGAVAGASIWWGAAGVSLLLCLGWMAASRVGARGRGALARRFAALSQALAFYRQPARRGAVGTALALSLLFQASQVLLNIGLARALSLPVGAATFWWLVPLLSLSGLVPAGIGGFGVREAAALALLRADFAHLAPGQIVAWSLLWQATVWLASLPGALFLRGAARS